MSNVIPFPRRYRAAEKPTLPEPEPSMRSMQEAMAMLYIAMTGAMELATGKPAEELANFLMREMIPEASPETAALCNFIVNANAPVTTLERSDAAMSDFVALLARRPLQGRLATA